MITFNKPYFTGMETSYIEDAVKSGKISGNGKYTNLCHEFFQKKYGFQKCLLTTSCTDALEMASILINIQAGDEVIMPAYTFVSTANAFVLRGAKIVFADSRSDRPGIDEDKIEELITSKTRAIVPVHYAGVACDMDKIMAIANKFNLFVIEDAAQAIDSYYIGTEGIRRPLGSIGHLAAFSFHETKNVISGEGGMLVVNDSQFNERAEVIWEKGTNRSKFFRGEVDKYSWVDLGSSFLPSEIIAAFLWAQLENIEKIQQKRINIWNSYYEFFSSKFYDKYINLPIIPQFATNNAHMFYIVCQSQEQREIIISELKKYNVNAVFHYLSLSNSEYYLKSNNALDLNNSENYSNCLIRLPFYIDIDLNFVFKVINKVFYEIFENKLPR